MSGFRYIVFVSLFMTACLDRKKDIDLEVLVRSYQGQAIANAFVKLNGKQIGKTDGNGRMTKRIEFSVGSSHSIEISKTSTKEYFGNHFEDLQITEKSAAIKTIQAVLFHVPINPKANESSSQASTEAKEPKNTPQIDTFPKETPPESADTVAAEPSPEDSSVAEQILDDLSPQVSVENSTEFLGLTSVDLSKTETLDYPKERKKTNRKVFHKFRILNGKKAVKNAEVFVGAYDLQDYQLGCRTDSKGICALAISNEPKKSTIMVKTDGFLTKEVSVALKPSGITTIKIYKGTSLDVYAVVRTFDFTSGLSDLEVRSDGKIVGKTNRFGHLTKKIKGSKDDLIEVSISNKSYLPEVFETNFVVGGPLSITKYFTPKTPPKVRLAILSTKHAGKINQDLIAKGKKLDTIIQKDAKKNIFQNRAFHRYSMNELAKTASEEHLTITEIVQNGWKGTNLKAHLDAILVPTLIGSSESQALEISLVDSTGRVRGASQVGLSDNFHSKNIEAALVQLEQQVIDNFEFEGAVLERKNQTITINLGFQSGRGLKPGDNLNIFGLQNDTYGLNKKHTLIAKGKVTQVAEKTSTAKLSWTAKRSLVARGDLVVLQRSRKVLAKAKTAASSGIIKITEHKDPSKPIIGANVYLNNKWITSSDEEGYIKLGGLKQSGTLKVVKHGYSSYQAKKLPSITNSISLQRLSSYLRLNSVPEGAKVLIDGKEVGMTPLDSPLMVTSGFVRIEVEGLKGFKPFAKIIDLGAGTIDLTGPQSIKLEVDYLAKAHNFQSQQKWDQAIATLAKVDASHSDYLQSQHILGEIYVTQLRQPKKAVSALKTVTEAPKVASFNDKRFIGSHINLGIAYFLEGEEQLANDQKTAISAYENAIATLDSTIPYLRYLPVNPGVIPESQVRFYKNLALHRLWNITKDPSLANQVVNGWNRYVEDDMGGQLKERALTYLKQAQSNQGVPYEDRSTL